MVEGFAAAPSLTRANALGQYLFVNGRPVRDKLILGAVRAAYSDYLPRDRHPVVALFVTLDPQEVDANVHPAKTEVRFRNAGLVRALIVHALKEGLAREGKRTAANSDGAALASFRPCVMPRRARQLGLAALAGLSAPRAAATITSGLGARLPPLPNQDRPRSMSARRPQTCVSSETPSATCSTVRSARRARKSTRPISCHRPATVLSSWTSTPPMNASSMKS